MTDVVAREAWTPGPQTADRVVGTISDAVGTFRYTIRRWPHRAGPGLGGGAHRDRPVPILGTSPATS